MNPPRPAAAPAASPSVARIHRAALIVPIGLIALSAATAHADPVVQTFFVPLPEAQTQAALLKIFSGVSSTMNSITSIASTQAGTIIYYDQWENGYENDIGKPLSIYNASTNPAGTQIWGDNNPANGFPPHLNGVTNTAMVDIIGKKEVLSLENTVALPRNSAQVRYDGRDKFGSTRALAVSRAQWATTPGTLLAGAVEVYSVREFGTSFESPVGEDLNTLSYSMFETVGMTIMASKDGTTITVDKDGPGGGAAVAVGLNQGESYHVNGGVLSGATVLADRPVQAHLLTGDVGSTYESRWFTLFAKEKWSNSYYSPVGTANNDEAAFVFLYNPASNAGALTINYQTQTGSGTISVASGAVARYQMPKNSGARFYSANTKPFFAVEAVGANPSANHVYDWGFTLVPESSLTTELVVGWGPGSDPAQPPLQSGSPVWVSARRAAIVYVDYDGDGVAPLTAPNGDKYDLALNLAALQSKTVIAPDKDSTGMRLFTTDGALITGAWGQDPAVAGTAAPYLDLGTTILPFPVPSIDKSAILLTDVDSSGAISINDILRYKVAVKNDGFLPLAGFLAVDSLPANIAYLPNTTTFNGAPMADDGAGATVFPLDEVGFNVPTVQPGASVIFTYDVRVLNGPTIINTVYGGDLSDTETVYVTPPAGATACAVQFTNAGGSPVSFYAEGAALFARLTDADQNSNNATKQTVLVTITNTSTGDVETLALEETTVSSGIFTSAVGLPSSASLGLGNADGILHAIGGDSLEVSHHDARFFDTCSATATVSFTQQSKHLYLSDPAQALDRLDPVGSGDATTASTAIMGAGTASISVVGTAVSSNVAQTVSTHSFSYNAGATASNRILMVGVSYLNANSQSVSGVSYGGQALALVGTTASGTAARVSVWRLVNPPTGSNSLQVNWSAALTQGAVVGAVVYSGVDQSSPTGTYGTNSSTTGSPSVAVPSASGKLVFGVVGGRTTTDFGAAATQLWSARPFSGNTAGSGQSAPGAGSSVSLTWTSTSAAWAAGGVSLNPVANGITSTTFTQAPTFASGFSLPASTSPSVSAYYSVVSGTMPANPNISAILKRGATTVATSNSASASGGLLTFGFAPLATAVSFASGEALRLDITTAQSGVTFRVDYDSTTKPSKITLPTTTFIKVVEVAAYDAPYPGGSLVTDTTNGQTLYVRTTVTDPFGAADITDLDLTIIDPVAGAALINDVDIATVSAAGHTKIYEYQWHTGANEGSYALVATATEGFEITPVKHTGGGLVRLTHLDLGTPGQIQFIDGLGGSTTSTYPIGTTLLCVRVTDLDQAGASGMTAGVSTSNGQNVTVTLTETGTAGVFEGCQTVTALPASTTLTASYIDPNDPSDLSSGSALVPAAVPSNPAVAVSKTRITASPVLVGTPVQYDIVVSNPSDVTLTNIQVTDTPPAQLTFSSASVAPDTVGATIVWNNVGPLAGGQSRTITTYFTANAVASPATNSVSVDADSGTATAGPATADVTVLQSALTVTKDVASGTPASLFIGGSVTFDLTIDNTGTTNLTSVPLIDNYSTCYQFSSATIAPTSAGGGVIYWADLGPLTPSDPPVILSVTFDVVAACAPAPNTARVAFALDQFGNTVAAAQDSAAIDTTGGSIGDLIWRDQDGDGTKDSFEGGIENVLVWADLNNNGTRDPNEPFDLSDATGFYQILNLGAGTYTVRVDPSTLPAGVTQTGDPDALIDNAATASVSEASPDFTLADFGYQGGTASIAGTVFDDTTNPGVLDPGGDTPIPNVNIQLWTDPDGNGDPSDGTMITSTTTNASGDYVFNNLGPGKYVVVEIDPHGATSVTDSQGDTTDPEFNRIPVLLADGLASVDNDFLDSGITPGSIGGRIVNDTNANGIDDAEPLVTASVTVQLWTDPDGDGDPSDGVKVDELVTTSGTYLFGNVTPGKYVIVEIDAAGYGSTGDLDGIGNGYNQIGLTLSGGQSSTGNDFLDTATANLATVSGKVYADSDNSGTFSGLDTPLGGVGIAIYLDNGSVPGAKDASDTLVASTITIGDGSYSFGGLPPGDYIVFQPTGGSNVSDIDGPSNGNDAIFVDDLAAGESRGGRDFLMPQSTATGSITGFVYLDDGSNSPVGSATVQLWSDPNGDGIPSDGVLIATTATAPDGSYSFSNLVDGNYVVQEINPPGLISVTDSDEPHANSEDQIGVALSAGVASIASADFLDRPLKLSSFTDWQTEFAAALGSSSAPDDNPDGDLYDNALEYALCNHPGSGLNANPFCVEFGGSVDAIYHRATPAPSDVTYTLQIAPALGSPPAWTTATTSPVVLDLGDGIARVTYPDLEAELASGIARLRIDIAGDSTGPHDTPVFGWSTVSAQAECETCSDPYAPKEIFSGTVTSGSTVLELANSVGSGSIASTLQNRPHYVEVLSGSYAGHRIEVASATATTIALATSSARNTLDPIPSLAGAQIALRTHKVIDDVVSAAGFIDTVNPSKNDDPATAGRVLFFDNANGWSTYFAFNSSGGITPQWTSAENSFLLNVGDAVLANGNDELVIIDPCVGFFVHSKAQAVDVLMVGIVREWNFACPLGVGYNFVGSAYPVDQSPDGRDMSLSYFNGTTDPATADQAEFWISDGPTQGVEAYESHFRVLAGATYDYWTTQESSALPDEDAIEMFKRQRAAFINSRNGNAKTLAGAWIWPVPWDADAP